MPRLWCLIAALTVVGEARAQQRVVPSDRVTSGVRVRGTPSAESDDNIRGLLRPGESAPLIHSDIQHWHHVELGGVPSFVSKSWTSVIGESEETDTGVSNGGNGAPVVTGPAGALMRVHFLNSGTGACQVVECPGAAPIIFDCGSTGHSDPDMDREEVVAYVQAILDESGQAPRVVISHADRDHYSYVPDVMGDRTPESIWLGGERSEYGSPVAAWLNTHGAVIHDDFAPGFSNNGQPVAGLGCGPADTRILTVNNGTSKNAQSLVAAVQHGTFSVVFTGDAEGETQQSVLANFPGLRATLLSGSHHGASTHDSNDAVWANAILPEVVVFTTGTKFGHPRCAATDVYLVSPESRVRNAGPHPMRCGIGGDAYGSQTSATRAVYSTRTNGTVVVDSNGSTYNITCSRAPSCGHL